MKRFFNLKFGEKFEINGVTFQKEAPFRAVLSYGSCIAKFFWPWNKVRTCEFGYVRPKHLILEPKTTFASPPRLGDRKHKDDERTGPSA